MCKLNVCGTLILRCVTKSVTNLISINIAENTDNLMRHQLFL